MTTMLNQICTFRLDDLHFGVPVEDVQEVTRYRELTSVPLASKTIGGLINLRGQIVTAIDLRQRLQLPPLEEGESMKVIIRTDDGPAALLVDEIGDVIEVTDDVKEPPPPTLGGVTRELVNSVFKLKGRVLLVLDTEKAIRGNG